MTDFPDRNSPEVNVKTFTLRVETPDGALPPAQIEIPDIPLGLADLAPPMFELCNGVTGLAIKAAGQNGKKVTCGPGCGSCCCQLVPVSIPEALFIMDTVLSPSNDRAGLFRQRFSECKALLESDGLWTKLASIDTAENDADIAFAYWNRQIPCPFLIDGSCAIHPVRPCACREYNVTSDPTLCANPFVNDIDRIRVSRKTTTALAKTAGRLLGQPPQLIPLVQLLDWCDGNREFAELRWKGIGLFDLLLEIALK
jgi:Fe-S-cluster containining protein